MSKPRDDWQEDLLRPPLDEIIGLKHPLAHLARQINWGSLDERFSSECWAGPAAAADPTGRWAADPQSHARFVGRGLVRALAGEPLLPILMR